MKIAVFMLAGIIIGSVTTLFVTARLSAELEAQTRLAGLTQEIGTVAIYFKKLNTENDLCFLMRQVVADIESGNDIKQWISKLKVNFSGLNQLHIDNFEGAVTLFENETKVLFNEHCK